jgi:phage shock protein PspC (stress-responsive transcriptional regulator)
VIAGVAGGLADRIGVSPLLVRLLFVVAALGAGAGLLLYLALWWLLPREDLPESGSEEFLRRFLRAPAWAGRIILIAGVAVVASQIAPDPYGSGWSPPLVIGAVLVAVGVALFRQDLVRDRGGDSALRPPVGPGQPPTASLDTDVLLDRPVEASVPGRDRPRRERSRLGVLTAGSSMIALSLAVLLDGVGAIRLDVGRFPALALVVVGAGLLVGAWWGRARGAIALGLVLLPIALVLSLIHQPFGGVIGSRALSPGRREPFPGSQEVLAGQLVVDLMRQDLARSTHVLEIEMGAGSVDVVVPIDVTLRLAAEVGMGALSVPGEREHVGVDLSRELTIPGRPGGGVLILTVDQGVGRVEVRRQEPLTVRSR